MLISTMLIRILLTWNCSTTMTREVVMRRKWLIVWKNVPDLVMDYFFRIFILITVSIIVKRNATSLLIHTIPWILTSLLIHTILWILTSLLIHTIPWILTSLIIRTILRNIRMNIMGLNTVLAWRIVLIFVMRTLHLDACHKGSNSRN